MANKLGATYTLAQHSISVEHSHRQSESNLNKPKPDPLTSCELRSGDDPGIETVFATQRVQPAFERDGVFGEERADLGQDIPRRPPLLRGGEVRWAGWVVASLAYNVGRRRVLNSRP